MKLYFLIFLLLLGCGCSTVREDESKIFKSEQEFYFCPTEVKTSIEAENFTNICNAEVENGTHVGFFSKGSWIGFKDVNFFDLSKSIYIGASSENSGGEIEIRIDSINGKIIGSFTMESTGGWFKFEDFQIPIEETSGTHDVYFIGIKGDGILNLDSWEVSEDAVRVIDPLKVDYSRGEWTLVVIPDTQHYSQNRKNAPIDNMRRAFQWIVDMRGQLNIQMVQGLGDITESWDNEWEWSNSFSAWNKLEGIVGYMPVMGNHDSPRSMNKWFPVSRFKNHGHWGGDFGGIENNYLLLTIGKEDYMFLHVEPYDEYSDYRPEGIAWAKKVLAKFPKKRVILATHDNWNTRHIRDQILSKFDNIVLSNAGHTCVREKYFTTNGPQGGVSNNFIIDYQCDPNEVMLIRYYIFRPLEDKVDFYTYSPITGQFEKDWDSQGSFYLYQED